jgi:hypothetical protein
MGIRKGGKTVYMVGMKPVEIVLRREGEGNRENDGGGKSN